jgi:hypothetical protein
MLERAGNLGLSREGAVVHWDTDLEQGWEREDS